MTENVLDRAGEAALYRALRRFWHPVLWADELGDRPVAAMLLDEPMVHRPPGRRGARVQGPVRPSRDGAVARLGRRRPPRVRLPRLDVRPGRRLHPDPVQPRHEHPEQGADRAATQAVEHAGLIWVCLDDDAPRHAAARRSRSGPTTPIARSRSRSTTGTAAPRGGSRTSSTSATSRGSTRASWAIAPSPRSRTTTSIRDATTLSFELGIEEPATAVKGDAGDGGRIQRSPPLHDLDAVLGPPRPAARRTTATSSCSSRRARCRPRRPATSPGTRGTTSSTGRATRASSTSSS